MVSFNPHEYQRSAIDWLTMELAMGSDGGALWLDPGLGKTAITLQTILELRRHANLGRKVLVIAPLRVIYSTWPEQITSWGFPFSYTLIHGSEKQRRSALLSRSDIYLINPEGIPWLYRTLKERKIQQKQWDITVIDESTKFKTWSAQRTRALRALRPLLGKIIELTGTPAPNSYIDLFSQIWMLDEGNAIGKTLTAFRDRYCTREIGNGFARWVIRPGVAKELEAKIAPMVLHMSALEHLDMPELVVNKIKVDLPPKILFEYRRLEKQLFLQLDSGQELFASSAGAKYSMCRSVANGGAYIREDGERREEFVHNAKVEAVEDLVEELSGKPLLVAYLFDHDLHRLRQSFPDAPVIKGGMSPKHTTKLIDEWNEQRHQVLFVQPQALAHGANMQHGGHDICWFGLTDQPEIHTQFNARLWRQGQKNSVRLHYLIARRTVDEAVWDRIQDKDKSQAALLQAIRRYRNGGGVAA